MSHKGRMRGCMGWASTEHPVTIELIKQWNELGKLCGFIYSDDEIPMPEHLSKLNEAINYIREYLQENPRKIKNVIEEIEITNPKYEIREGKSFLIGGDIIWRNGLIIGKVDKNNPHSFGMTGTMGIQG